MLPSGFRAPVNVDGSVPATSAAVHDGLMFHEFPLAVTPLPGDTPAPLR